MSLLPVLAAENVWRTLAHQRVLRGIDLTVPAGGGVAILGPNGAGKSTFMRVLAAVLRPQRGCARIFGEDPWASPEVRRKIGFAGHEPMLYGGLTTLENLQFFLCLYGLPDGHARADAVCDLLGIRRRHDPVRILSRGMQQRAALARAIVHRPQVLLLDEALTGLDPEAAQSLYEFLGAFRAAGGVVVLTTHSPGEALRVADRAYVLARGRLSDAQALAGLNEEDVEAWYRATLAGVEPRA